MTPAAGDSREQCGGGRGGYWVAAADGHDSAADDDSVSAAADGRDSAADDDYVSAAAANHVLGCWASLKQGGQQRH